MKSLSSGVITFLMSLFSFFSYASNSPSAPDFSKPRDVMACAENGLQKAVQENNEAEAVRQLLNFYIAYCQIDPQDKKPIIDLIGTASSLKSPAIEALCNLLRAKIDLTEEDHEGALSHIKQALNKPEVLSQIPLKEFASVISPTKQRECYLTNLFQFIGLQSIETLEALSFNTITLPQKYLCAAKDFINLEFSTIDETANLILNTYATLLRKTDSDAPAYVVIDLERISYLDQHTWENYTQVYNLLVNLYKRTGNPLPLFKLSTFVKDKDREFYNLVSEASKVQSSNKELKDLLSVLSQPCIGISLPNIMPAKKEIPIKVALENTNIGRIDVYRNNSIWENSLSWKTLKTKKPILSIPILTDSTAIPFKKETTVSVTFPEVGSYILVPRVKGQEPNNQYFAITVTNLGLIGTHFIESGLWAVDLETGKPLPNVTIITPEKTLGATGRDGSFNVTEYRGKTFKVKRGEDFSASCSLWYSRYKEDESWRLNATGFPSLSLYRPGDKVDWFSTLYEVKGAQRRLAANTQVKAILHDAAYQPVDTLELTSDNFGRISGSFFIPKNALSGNFTINLKSPKGTEIYHGISFEVSDYKLPSFKIDLEPVEIKDSSAILRGKVQTYSEFPLTQTQVKLNLSAAQFSPVWYRGYGQYSEFFTDSVKTDDKGEFKIIVPKSALELAPDMRGLFKAEVTVTSETGENQRNVLTFALHNQYAILTDIPQNINADSADLYKVKVVDYKQQVIDQPIDYLLKSTEDSVEYTGRWPIKFSQIPSGSYSLKLTTQDAEPTVYSLVIYRSTDQETPSPKSLFWAPETDVKVSHYEGHNPYLYAVNHDCHLLVTMVSAEKKLAQEWIPVKKGMHTLDMTLPEGIESGVVTILAIGNYQSVETRVALTAISALSPKVDISVSSFRDHTAPGSVEKWTFKIAKSSSCAFILDMWNQALDAIQPNRSELWFETGRTPYFSMLPPEFRDSYCSSNYLKPFSSNLWKVTLPSFQTYGYNVFGYGRHRFMNRLMAKADMVSDLEAFYANSTDEVKGTGEEPKHLDVGVTQAEKAPAMEPRPFETALGYFNPLLTTDSLGNLSLEVRMPNEVSTWNVRATAYNASFQVGSLLKTLVTSRPIMVQPNLPRFLRVGDKVRIQASVMNNSEEPQTVTTTVEFFNPLTHEIIQKSSQTDVIEAKKSSVIEIFYDVADTDRSAVGFRIISETKGSSDGEQGLIPILPSVTPVIESKNFVILPEEHETIIPYNSKGSATLTFNASPSWALVKALPGLLKTKSSSSLDAGLSYFSAATAQDIIKNNPEIITALRQWIRSERGDSSLISNLQKSQRLKIALLNTTPWVEAAENETQRMARLSLLLDDKEMSQFKERSLHQLLDLQNPDGGFKWFAGCTKSSTWITENILWLFAETGYRGEQVERAVRYLDAHYAELCDKDATFVSYQYTTLRQLYDYTLPRKCQKIIVQTIQDALTSWKRAEPAMMAIDAMMLNRAGYSQVAREIMESLTQRAKMERDNGMWWPSISNLWFWSMGNVAQTSLILDAYRELMPENPDISKIVQWIVLEKLSMNWGSSVQTSEIISSVFKAQPFKRVNGNVTFKLGDKEEISPDDFEKVTGDITFPLPNTSKSVTIETEGLNSFCYGSVFNSFSQKVSQVKAQSCRELKLTREYQGINPQSHEVTISLLIEASRDMDYVTLIDPRPACFEPMEQVPTWEWSGNTRFYRENRDSETRYYIERLPRGKYRLSYKVWINNQGEFSAPPAEIQSLYQPPLTAHSSGILIVLNGQPLNH